MYAIRSYYGTIAYAPERSKIAAGSYDYKIKIWNVETTEVELELEGHKKSTLPVAFSPDEKYLVSGSLDKTVKVWNAKTGELRITSYNVCYTKLLRIAVGFDLYHGSAVGRMAFLMQFYWKWLPACRITSYNVCYTKLLRQLIDSMSAIGETFEQISKAVD